MHSMNLPHGKKSSRLPFSRQAAERKVVVRTSYPTICPRVLLGSRLASESWAGLEIETPSSSYDTSPFP